ncbi:MAG: T9SS type A sorting domain-containing protein [Saprospiraceae bacterium]
MFQRQSRRAFPVRTILLFTALIAAFLYLLVRNLHRDEAATTPPPTHEQNEEEGGKDLRPAEWFFTVREYPDFKTDVNTYVKAIRQVAQGAVQRGNPGFGAAWTVQGPGNIGARVNTIKVHPNNPDIIYIGYSHGGVWKTQDGGENWFPVFDEQPFLAISDIELDPQDPNVVYVGTGDHNISGYPFIGDGLWRSPDGGQHWQHLGLDDQRIVSKIIVHPNNANTIYVATMGLPFERNNDRGLYKTTNGGLSWQQVLFVSDSTGITDMVMAPGNPDVIYAAAWDRIRNNQESIVSGENARIWKTTDGGANWAALESGLPDFANSRIGLSISANDPNYVLAVYVSESLDYLATFKTSDGGANWSALPEDGLDTGFMNGFGWYFGKIFINPFDPNDIFICGVELWRSLDGGDTWFQTTPEWWLYEVHADKHDMAFINPSTFLLATDGGLYKTSDGGFEWEKIENIPTSQFYRVAYNPFSPDWYFGGMQDNGTSGGNNAFMTEWPRIYGGDGFQAVFHPEDENIYYFETQNGNIVGSFDGFSIDQATDGIDDDDRRSWDMPYMMSRHDYNTMYTGTYRIYQGFGHLPFWFPISDDLTDGIIFGSRYHFISAIDESPLDPALLYTGTSDGNVWRGDPTTQEWTSIIAGLPDRYVSSVKASPNITDRVYVAHTGYKSNDFSPHLHRSDDRGDNWVSVAGDLPALAINDIQVLPGHQDSIIFVATDGGVYGTLDGGQHWERLGTGMPIVPVYDIELNPIERTLIAGTYARSIMSFPLDSLQNDDDVSTFTPGGKKAPELLVTPNPASDHAMLTTRNTSANYETEVFVYDLSGRMIREHRFKGFLQREIPLDVQNMPSGVYIVFARTNGKVWGQQKIVVAR